MKKANYFNPNLERETAKACNRRRLIAVSVILPFGYVLYQAGMYYLGNFRSYAELSLPLIFLIMLVVAVGIAADWIYQPYYKADKADKMLVQQMDQLLDGYLKEQAELKAKEL